MEFLIDHSVDEVERKELLPENSVDEVEGRNFL
jgi:hypothetical protein